MFPPTNCCYRRLAIKLPPSCRGHTVSLRFLVLLGCIFGLASPAAHAASSDNLILGTWQLNVARSRFTPGPGWQSQIRVYRATPEGVAVTWTGVDAKGGKMQVSYAYAYDGRDYPMLGSANYDTLNAVSMDDRTVRSEEKRDGKTVGIAVRTISPDGKVLTITDEGTNRKGQKFSQLLVFDRQ